MKGVLTYDTLKRNAIETRAELFGKGLFPQARRKVRKKPRPNGELNILYERAIEKAIRYRPYYDKDRKLILPYFLR